MTKITFTIEDREVAFAEPFLHVHMQVDNETNTLNLNPETQTFAELMAVLVYEYIEQIKKAAEKEATVLAAKYLDSEIQAANDEIKKKPN